MILKFPRIVGRGRVEVRFLHYMFDLYIINKMNIRPLEFTEGTWAFAKRGGSRIRASESSMPMASKEVIREQDAMDRGWSAVNIRLTNKGEFFTFNSKKGAQQLLDSNEYIYSHKKDKDIALSTAWRCYKYGPPTKCPCRCYLAISDNSLSMGTKPHNLEADMQAPERREILKSLKRKS